MTNDKNNNGPKIISVNAGTKLPDVIENNAKPIATIPVLIKNHRDLNGGHPHVIVDNIEDKHVSVGLTTKKFKGKNHPNITLEVDPLSMGEGYMRRQGTVDDVSNYTRERQGLMTENDHNKALSIGAKAKEKYLRTKNADK